MPLKVFYDPRQVVENNKSFSPSAGKPKLVVEEWTKKGYSFELAPVTPVTREDFYLAHNKEFVDDVLDCKRNNGFENRLPEVATALPWTTGSMLSAARYAIENKINTCSPTSGFHHAEVNRSMGFCTFNGLMVAAVKLQKEGLTNHLGIVDIDHHYGNGTDDIILRRGLGYVQHYTFGGAERDNDHWKGGTKAQIWLEILPSIIEDFKNNDVIFYQAGGDPHVDDPYGGALTNDQMRERDRIVFEGFKKLGIPVVWNLAGGYQSPIQKVLDIHNATIEECLKTM